MQVNMYGAADAARKRLAEQTAQQGDQGDTDESNAAASHQLLHTLTLGRGVIAAVTFHEVHSMLSRVVPAWVVLLGTMLKLLRSAMFPSFCCSVALLPEAGSPRR